MWVKQGKKLLLQPRRFHSRSSGIINPTQKPHHNKTLIETKWKLMASELRDNLVKIYLQMPYKNSLQLSPALQKLQKQFNDNSLIKYTWSAISAVAERNSIDEAQNDAQNDAVVVEKKKEDALVPKWKLNKSVVSKACILSRTRHLISLIKSSQTDQSSISGVDALIAHLKRYPESKYSAISEGIIGNLLYLKERTSCSEVQGAIREAFALLGYAEELPAKGIRILSIDGGGIRGLLVIEMLKKLEELTQKKVCEMFDLVCGVSTGAILASLLATQRISLDELAKKYREMSVQIFSQSRLNGTTNLFLNHSYYDTAQWEKILKEHLAESTLTSTNRSPKCPKLCTISAVVNQSRLYAYLFRNYSLPCRIQSQYMGSCDHLVWEAIRASAAAPTYFEEFRLGNLLHQDGGIIVNNPTAVALHEAKLLWPNSPIQCVLSFGTGRSVPHPSDFDPQGASINSSSWKNKFMKIIESATDTEGVHTMLCDLLPAHTYFRFNPYLTEMCNLEETDPKKIEQLERDVLMYLRRNDDKFKEAADVLQQDKTYAQHALSWFNNKKQILSASLSQ